MAKAVTALDVAREAGVSQATVSYVINDHPSHKIAPETRARVLEAVARLGYTPSAAARALRKGSTDIALLILPDVPTGPAVAFLLERLTDELELAGLVLVTRRVRQTTERTAPWRELRPAVVVPIVSSLAPELEVELRSAGIPVVGSLLEHPSPDDGTSLGQILAGRYQVEHLAATGHLRLGYADPADERVRAFVRLRLEGVRLACMELGLDEPVVLPVPLEVEKAAEAVARWRSLPEPVTAVCAYNDETAFAVLAGMHRLGLEAPDDLAVIGVDDIPLAPLASPPLTTVDQGLDALTLNLAQRIVGAVRGTPSPPRLRSDTVRLVLRRSA
jgi:DNA-binding LacI/PurR family transcriptional regulator